MKFLIFFAFVAIAAAAPQRKSDEIEVTILKAVNENDASGTYHYLYELSDGTKVEESGYLKPNSDPKGEPIQVATGSFEYYSKDIGQFIRVQYIADENGFQPRGDHLPKPPPIPEGIQKVLDIIDYNRKHPGPKIPPTTPFRKS